MYNFSITLFATILIFVTSGFHNAQSVSYGDRQITKPPKQQEFSHLGSIQQVSLGTADSTEHQPYRDPVLVYESSKAKARPARPSGATLERLLVGHAPPPARQQHVQASPVRGNDVSVYCGSESGQFPYPPDCRKFVNCWHGRAFLQVCAPGTLFSAERYECEHPHKAQCVDDLGSEVPSFNYPNNQRQTGYRQYAGQQISGRPLSGRTGFGGAQLSPYLVPPAVSRLEYPDPVDRSSEGTARVLSPTGQQQSGSSWSSQRTHQQHTRQFPSQVLTPPAPDAHSTYSGTSAQSRQYQHTSSQGQSSQQGSQIRFQQQAGSRQYQNQENPGGSAGTLGSFGSQGNYGGVSQVSQTGQQQSSGQFHHQQTPQQGGLTRPGQQSPVRQQYSGSGSQSTFGAQGSQQSSGQFHHQQTSQQNPSRQGHQYQNPQFSGSGSTSNFGSQAGGFGGVSQGSQQGSGNIYNQRPGSQAGYQGVGSQQRAPLTCPEPTGLFRHPYDCAQYLQCWDYRLWERPCAPGTHFNPLISVCDFPYNVRCDTREPDGGIDSIDVEVTPPPEYRPDIDFRSLSLNPSPASSTTPAPVRRFDFEEDSVPSSSTRKPQPRPTRRFVPVSSTTPAPTTTTPPSTTPFIPDEIPEEEEYSSTPEPPTTPEPPISTPHGGQKVRLRNGPGPWEGLVEVYLGSNLGWGFLCDVSGNWSLNEANVLCHQLGYERGAELAWQGSRQGLAKSQWPQLSVQCSGEERTLLACSAKDVSGLGPCDLARHGAAVRCARPPRSVCRPEEIAWGESCYRLTGKARGWGEARAQCEAEGANLLVVNSQAENDFVSEWLIASHPSIGKVFTAGIGVNLMNNTMWAWQGSSAPFSFVAWWPGWRSNGTAAWPVLRDSEPRCVVGSRFFACPPERPLALCDQGYLYWEAMPCEEEGWAVCERNPDDIGCVSPGQKYSGPANVTVNGLHCLPWNVKDSKLGVLGPAQRNELSGHNSCRELPLTVRRNEIRGPWCFVAPGWPEPCDIPPCPHRGEPRASSYTSACKSNDFRCPGGGCVSRDWICDGDRDCPNGEDELQCDDLLADFSLHSFSRLIGQDREKYLDTSREKCAKLCLDASGFECRSFSYHGKNRTCMLSATNIGTTGLAQLPDAWELHERSSTAMDCSNKFVCANKKCLTVDKLCNGKDECGDRSDERDCGPGAVKFSLRLTGGDNNSSHEGRLEVRAFGRWGLVCDDKFDMLDAHVVCRELGFALGAADVVRHAFFADPVANVSGLPFLMDEVQCAGTENSLSECPFSGWGEHDCNPEEVAGVVCRVPGLPCEPSQFRCDSGECVALSYLCDEHKDCADGSDELEEKCTSSLSVRLVGGETPMEGRVELRYLGVWGTVCDDSFDQPDAQVICRMLGYWGPAKALKKATFGPGKDAMWLDEVACLGSELNVAECGALPWGEHNCAHAEDVGVRCSQGNFTLQTRHQEPVPTTPAPKPRKATFFPAQCGEIQLPAPLQPQITPRVIGGAEVRRGDHPWQVSLRVRGPNGRTAHWCGAVLISNLHVLTAAHCVADHPKPKFVVRVGDHDSQIVENFEEELLLEDVVIHEHFNSGPRLNNDLALLRLKEPGVRFSNFSQPACVVPAKTAYSHELNCTISGWGAKGPDSSSGPSRYLRAGGVQMIPDETCRSKHVYGPESITEGMVCAGNLQGGVDSCTGDSGGPLICSHQGRHTVYGITSWGRGCGGSHKPGVYVRLSHYRRWIEQTILDLEEDDLSNQIQSLA